MVFEDLFDNKMACSYFKQFLDTRMESEIMYIWNIVEKKTNAENIFVWSDDETEGPENRVGDLELGDFQIKFVDEIRSKIFKCETLSFDYGNVSSLRVLLQQILS